MIFFACSLVVWTGKMLGSFVVCVFCGLVNFIERASAIAVQRFIVSIEQAHKHQIFHILTCFFIVNKVLSSVVQRYWNSLFCVVDYPRGAESIFVYSLDRENVSKFFGFSFLSFMTNGASDAISIAWFSVLWQVPESSPITTKFTSCLIWNYWIMDAKTKHLCLLLLSSTNVGTIPSPDVDCVQSHRRFDSVFSANVRSWTELKTFRIVFLLISLIVLL